MKFKHIFWLTLRQFTKMAFGTTLLVTWLTFTTSGLKTTLFFYNTAADYTIHYQQLYGSIATGFTAYQSMFIPKRAGDVPQFYLASIKLKPHWIELWQKKAPLLDIEIHGGQIQTGVLDQAHIQQTDMSLDIQAHYSLSKAIKVDIGGHWLHHPLVGTLSLLWQNDQFEIESIHLTQDKNNLSLSRNPATGFDVKLEIKHANSLSPLMHGTFSFDGWFDNLMSPQYFNMKGESASGRIGHYHLEELAFAIHHTNHAKHPLSVFITLKQLDINTLPSFHHQFHLYGTLDKQQLNYTADFYNQHVVLDGKLSHSSSGYLIELPTLEISGKHLAKWKLIKPGKIALGHKKNSIELTLQNSKQGHLILNAQDENNQQQAMLSIKQLPIKILHDLGLIESIMPGNINIDIQANAEHLQLQTASTLIQLESGAKNACQHKSCPQPQWFDFQKGEIKANYRHGDFESHYTLQINPLNKLHGQLAIKNFLLEVPFNEQIIDGQFNASIQDLSLIMQWLPDIARLKGLINVDTKITGSLLQPVVLMEAALTEGTMTLPRFGIKVKPLSLNLTSDNQGIFYLQGYGKMRNAEGDFTLTGSMKPFAKGFPNRIVLRSQNTQWANTPAFNILASPTLTFEFPQLDTLHITGDVNLLKGNINLDAYQENTTCISDDVIIISRQGIKNTASDFHVLPHIRIKTVNAIGLQGHNLKATVGGNLLITKDKGKLLGDGRITFKQGTYQLPGETLTIERGRLVYPPGTLLTDPVLDIRLMKSTDYQKSKQNKSGIYILGHLSEMEIENMGWLEGTSSDTLSHALSMSSSTLIDPIQKKLKLDKIVDTVGVTSIDRHGREPQVDIEQANVAFVVGKRLSDRIYAQVMKSFLDNDQGNESVEKARLNVELTQNASLGFEVSPKGQGIDLSFSIEKD